MHLKNRVVKLSGKKGILKYSIYEIWHAPVVNAAFPVHALQPTTSEFNLTELTRELDVTDAAEQESKDLQRLIVERRTISLFNSENTANATFEKNGCQFRICVIVFCQLRSFTGYQ